MQAVLRHALRNADTSFGIDLVHLELAQKCIQIAKHLSMNLQPIANGMFYPAKTGYISFLEDTIYHNMLVRILVLHQIGMAPADQPLADQISGRLGYIRNKIKQQTFFPVLTVFKTEEDIYESAQQQQMAISRKYRNMKIPGQNYKALEIKVYGFKTLTLVGQLGQKTLVDYFKIYTPDQAYMFNDLDVFLLLRKYRKRRDMLFVRVTNVATGVSMLLRPDSVLNRLPKSWKKGALEKAMMLRSEFETNMDNLHIMYSSQCEHCQLRGFCTNPMIYIRKRVLHGTNKENVS